MNILVIGGSGFIGSRLVPLLEADGHSVTIYDKVAPKDTTTKHIVADIRNITDLDAAVRGVDVIYNLAAEHRDDVRPLSLYNDVNVDGARNVISCAVRADVSKIIFTSSVAVYGESSFPLDESARHAYINEYGRTKSAAETEYKTWASSDPKRSLVIIRPSVVFGPGNRGNVHNLLAQIAAGRFAMIGDGTNRKSMAYVDNVASFAAWVMRSSRGTSIYNYADKPDFSMNDLVSQIREIAGKGSGVGLRLPVWLAKLAGNIADITASVIGRPLPISAVRVTKFLANTEVDSELAMKSGFAPPVSLEVGLAHTLRSEFGYNTP